MKIAALDAMWYETPLQRRIGRIAELGFEGIEFWLGSAELGFTVPPLWPEAHRLRRVAFPPRKLSEITHKAGVELAAFGQYSLLGEFPSLFGPTEVDVGRRREARIQDVKALMSYAAEAGGGIVIAESGGDPDRLEQWNSLIELTKELVGYAEKVGAVLAVENTPQFLIKDEDDLLRLMKEVESRALRVNFDPANLNLCPPGKKNVANAIRKLGSRIVCVHAKDSIYHAAPYGKTPEGLWDCPKLGQGSVPWRECIAALKDIGYDGYLIVEYGEPGHDVRPEDREKGMVEGKRVLKEYLAL